MLISIVIPCYNSQDTIEKVVDLCVEEFKKIDGYECEFVLVNDYSKTGLMNPLNAVQPDILL